MQRVGAIGWTVEALMVVGVWMGAGMGRWAAAQVAEQGTPPALRRVIIAFKTHFDIGYTDLVANVLTRYRTVMIDQALAVVDANRGLPAEQQFVWTLPGWPLSKIAGDWPGQSPQRKGRVLEAFRQGRFVVHALPFTTHTETLDLEDLVRGLGFSSRLCRQAGLPLPRDAKMTDVPCHSWILPTLLKHAGVDFLHLGCNAASSSPRVPMLFWWEGPDGSRLLTMYSAAGYGTGLVPPAGWPYRTWLALIHTGDNHGPPSPQEVAAVLEQARRKLPGVEVRIGRLSDFAEALLQEERGVPVVRGDMPDTWIHGPMCDPLGASLARRTRAALAGIEALYTQLRAWKVPVPDVAGPLASAYENSLLYGEHTWGGALSWVTQYQAGKVKFPYGQAFRDERAAGRFKRLEQSWADHTAYIESAHRVCEGLRQEYLAALAQGVAVPGQRIVVFNPLPWQRSGLVTVRWEHGPLVAVAPAEGGPAIPCHREGSVVRFVARDVPAMGYRTFVPASEPAGHDRLQVDAEAGCIESSEWRVVLDRQRLGIRSLVHRPTGRELADSTASHALGQYLYERFDADQVAAYVRAYVKIKADWAVNELGKPPMPPASQAPYQAASPQKGTLRIRASGGHAEAVIEGEVAGAIPHRVTTRVMVYEGLPYVDLEVTIHKKPADSWPEACWICLPLGVQQPRFRLARLGSIVDPARDLVPGSNRDFLWLAGGLMAVDSQGRGVGLCPLDHALVSLERPGCWRYTPDFVPRQARVYVNVFNNQWTTNFRMWNGGTWTSRVRLWAANSQSPADALVKPSLEARCGLWGAVATGPAGKLPASRQGLAISRPGATVTAFGPNPDGPGLVLRLWELAGQPGPCQVQLPAGLEVAEVQPVDLRGQPAGKTIAAVGGAFRFELPAFAPASFVLKAKD